MSKTLNVKEPSPEDIKNWRKMTFELLGRSSGSWVMFMIALLGLSYLASFISGPLMIQRISSITFQTIIGIVMYEVGTMISVDSDKQFSFSEFFKHFGNAFKDGSAFKIRVGYIIFSQIIISLIIFRVDEIPLLNKMLHNDSTGMLHYFLMFISLVEYMPSAILVIGIWSSFTLASHISYMMSVYYKADVTSKTMIVLQINEIVNAHAKKLVFGQGMILLGVLLIPGAALFFLPYFMTWNYVAQREMLFGGGNEKVKETVKAGQMVLQRAII